MSTPTHFFSVSYPNSANRLYCGEWKNGDSWTVKATDVTCPNCRKLLEEAGRRSEAPVADIPEVEEWVAGESLP